MSTIYAVTEYDGQLCLDHDIGRESFTFQWDQHTVNFGILGYSLSTEFELTELEQTSLVETLAKEDPSLPPHWQALPPKLHRVVKRMTDQILGAAATADACLRHLPKD